MTNSYIDWNCRLLSDIHESIITPHKTLEALSYLQSRYGLQTFCMMPTFLPNVDSVAVFLLRRDRSISDLIQASQTSQVTFQSPVSILAGASVLLDKGLHEVLNLRKLTFPFGSHRYLPIKLPLSSHADWIDFEINRILYRAGLKILFISFEIACLLYPQDVIEKLMRIDGAVYQFNYNSLTNSKIISVISALLHRNATVVFGTSLNNIYKIYHYEFEYYLDTAKEEFTNSQYSIMMKYNQKLPQKHPKLYRIPVTHAEAHCI